MLTEPGNELTTFFGLIEIEHMLTEPGNELTMFLVQ